MKLIEVKINSFYYLQGVALRKELFFKDFDNAQELIDDTYEEESTHIIVIKNEAVIATGRLTFKNTEDTTVISQMTVSPEHQGLGIGGQVLNKLLQISNSIKPNSKIQLSSRLTAVSFYEKHGFKTVGKTYPSSKTSILHIKMCLNK